MMRTLRRTLAGWKRELGNFWGRFNTFYRCVIGIVISIGIMNGANHSLLYPQQKKLKTITETLDKDGVPKTVPDPEADDDVLQPQIKAENIRRNSDNRTTRLKEIEASTPYMLDATITDAMGAILQIASEFKLKVQENVDVCTDTAKPDAAAAAQDTQDTPSDTLTPPDSPVPLTGKQLELRGSFLAIRSFLEHVRQSKFLWAFQSIRVCVLRDETGSPYLLPGGSPMLSLRCRVYLYLYRESAL